MAKNLYWSDDGFLTINVAKIANVTLRKVLPVDGNFSHLRALAVHPARGYLFWADWMEGTNRKINETKAKIERSNLDGSNRMTIVSKDIHWPNGLAIDYDGGWIFWSDAFLDRITKAKLDGSEVKTVAWGSQIQHPYGVAFYEGTIFWSEFRLSRIIAHNISELGSGNSSSYVTILEDSAPLFEIHVFDRNGQMGENGCSKKNGGCDQFCFYIPDTDKTGVTCGCADGFKVDPNNKTNCLNDASYQVTTLCDLKNQFECSRNKRCIDRKFVCDGDNDCGDNSDEDNRQGGACENWNCSKGNFRCNDNKCIPAEWQCDGDADCSNGEDESLAECKGKKVCGKDKFQCAVTRQCILLSWVCDYEPDCGKGLIDDDSDEHANCDYPACTADQFQCGNKQCIHASYVCDGDRDCRDGSDEAHCDTRCIPGEEFFCEPRGCISAKFKCDGVPNCLNGTDEDGCDKVNANGCRVNQKQCETSKECAPVSWWCDGDQDCLDNSDENTCPNGIKCNPATHFRCKDNKKCIFAKWKCNGHEDCNDGSDEIDCSSFRITENRCAEPDWSCTNDTSQCVSYLSVCDGKMDCADGSDEGDMCLDKRCSKHRKQILERGLCQYQCYDSPNDNGYVCVCPSGLKLQPDKKSCSKDNPCDQWGVCGQKCEPQGMHYFCHCEEGYQLMPNKFTCKSTSPVKPYIVFSNRHELRLIGLGARDSVSTSLAVNLRNSIAIDFYYKNENESYIFWTDIAADKIFRGTLTNGALIEVEIIVEHGIATTEGIAVDWIGKNLYWVDSSLDQIEVSKLDGTMRATVVPGEMQNLRALAVDPRDGWLFWTDWEENNPRIERCTLAGLNRKQIFSVTDVLGGGWPNGLTTDYVARRLYWIDAKSDSIHTIDYNGDSHYLVLRGHDFLSHPFAITLYGDHVYWTDWRVNSIVRANKWNGTAVKIIQGTSAQPFDIQVLHPSRQPPAVKNKCEERSNGGCSHLCLINSTSTYICKCPYLMKLGKDNKTCYEVNEALLYAQSMAIVGMDLEYPNANYMPVLTSKFKENISAMDVHTESRTVYWTDLKTKGRNCYLCDELKKYSANESSEFLSISFTVQKF